jgi:hypothetical protein
MSVKVKAYNGFQASLVFIDFNISPEGAKYESLWHAPQDTRRYYRKP